MDGIHFADGFDTPDRLAFGLGAPQLVAVVTGCLLAFGLLHAPLPASVAVPVAVVIVAVAATLGWYRVAGRPALDWAMFAARHLVGPRRGVLVVSRETGGRPETLRQAPQPCDAGTAAAGSPPSVLSNLASNIVHLPVPARGAHSSGSASPARAGARRIVFFSLKGGTGRTTLSTEIATWAAMRDVTNGSVIVDCDLRSACVGSRLGITQAGITDYAIAPPDERRLDEFLAMHRTGLRVLLGPPRSTNPDWPVTPAVLREVLRELDLSGASVVIVDVAPEMNGVTVTALRAADDIYVLVVPTTTGIHDAYRTTEQLRRLGLRDRLRYVVNRADGRVDVSVAMTDLGGQLVAAIPEDSALVDAENTHCPAVLTGGSAAAFELRRFAGLCAPTAYAAAR